MTVFGNIKNFINRGASPVEKAEAQEPQDVAADNGPAKDDEISRYLEISPRYKLIERIGEGAFSKVYKALDCDSGSYIAIKIIDKSHMSLQQVNSVLKEISIMSKITHENVVRLYSFKNSSRYCYLMMELVEGGEIFNQIINYTYFSEELSRHIILQVARGLKYLHEEIGVVHRDIKPENLLFAPIAFQERSKNLQLAARRKSDDNTKVDEGVFIEGLGGAGIGVVKIADFGLSKILWDNNTKTPVGTQGYTAPEILKDESYSKSVDCFSLGCVLYTLLCGFPPFYDNDPKVLAEKVSKGEYCFLNPWWNEVSQSAKDLVSNLLTVDASKRYTIDELLNHPWILQHSDKKSTKAIDYPTQTINKALYQQFNNDTSESLLTPRLEAIKFAFDTSNAVQLKQVQKAPLHGIKISEEEEEDFFSELDSDDSSIDFEEDEELVNSDDDDDDDDLDLTNDKIPILNKKNSLINDFKPIINKPAMVINEPIHFNNNDPLCSLYAHKEKHCQLPKTPIPRGSKPRMFKSSYNMAPKEDDFVMNSIKNFDLKLNASTMLSRRKLAGSEKCGYV